MGYDTVAESGNEEGVSTTGMFSLGGDHVRASGRDSGTCLGRPTMTIFRRGREKLSPLFS